MLYFDYIFAKNLNVFKKEVFSEKILTLWKLWNFMKIRPDHFTLYLF